MLEKVFNLLTDLIDNSTLIILSLTAVMLVTQDMDIVSTIVGGFLGYMVKRDNKL